MEKELKPGKYLKTRMKDAYEDRLKGTSSLFITEFEGLTNKELEDLRSKLMPLSAKYLIVKNSLCRIVLDELKMGKVSELVEGSCALSYGKGDPVSISKLLVDFAKKNKNLKIKGGYVDGGDISADMVKELASLPGRDVLIARLVSCINSPISGLVSACSGIIKKFVYALNEISKKKESKG
ncbi:MAG: 50S ribosomal protein L10 [Candidatus Omnitrophota bacterium]